MHAVALLHPSIASSAVAPFRIGSCSVDVAENLDPASRQDAAIILGGDGTVHRHLPQLRRQKTPLLVVPKGSGNDFAKSLGINNEAAALKAWRVFCDSGGENVAVIDLGLIRSGAAETLFCCVAGAGLDSAANARANRMPAWLRGSAGYFLAALQAVFLFRSTRFTLTSKDRTIGRSGLLAAVGNAHRYGHGMKIVPRAELSDGLLDVCFVGAMNRLKLLCCVPTIFFGAHLGIRQVEYMKSSAIRIETARPLELYADGEFAGTTPVEISILRGALKVIVPR
jgi:diacylglycerol kinase (ATP)